MNSKARVLSTLLFLIASLGVLVNPLQAQDDVFTCDNGPNDVVIAAQAAFDASELSEAHDLTVLALYICPEKSVKRLEAKALKGEIESFQAETEFLFDLTFLMLMTAI
jgi:hypothetical protein